MFKTSNADKIWNKYQSCLKEMKGRNRDGYAEYLVRLYMKYDMPVLGVSEGHDEFIKKYGTDYLHTLKDMVSSRHFTVSDYAKILTWHVLPYAEDLPEMAQAAQDIFDALGAPDILYYSSFKLISKNIRKDGETKSLQALMLDHGLKGDDKAVLTKLGALLKIAEEEKITLDDEKINKIGQALCRADILAHPKIINGLDALIQKQLPQFLTAYRAHVVKTLDELSANFNAVAAQKPETIVALATEMIHKDSVMVHLKTNKVAVVDLQTIKAEKGGYIMGELVSFFDNARQRHDVVMHRKLKPVKREYVEKIGETLVGQDVINSLYETYGTDGAILGEKLVRNLPKSALII